MKTNIRSAVVFGKGPLAIHAIQVLRTSGYEVAFVVPVSKEPTWTDSLSDWANNQGLEVIQSGRLQDLPIRRWDLGLSVFYDRIFKEDVMSRFGRLLNLHHSLLPRHRGVAPVHWALKCEDRVQGVSLHEIDAGIDTGPILAQIQFPIVPELDEVEDLYQRCVQFGTQLLSYALPRLDHMPGTAQDENLATYHDRRELGALGDRAGLRRPK
jgi:methionyl-tRNA formyltransferase